MSDAWVPTALELARLFRARECFLAGYIGERDDHRGEGTRHMCHLRDHVSASTPPRPGSVLRALRGIGLA